MAAADAQQPPAQPPPADAQPGPRPPPRRSERVAGGRPGPAGVPPAGAPPASAPPAGAPQQQPPSGRGRDGRRRRPRSPSPLRNPALEDYGVAERCYYRALPRAVRQRIAEAEARMRELGDDDVPLRFRVLLSELDEHCKAVAFKKLARLERGASEYHKLLAWVDGLCRLPVGRYRALPVTAASPRSDVTAFLRDARARMDREVYGHADAKGHILRLLAQWVTHPGAKGLVVGIHGPMGCGKTSLCKAVCGALGLPFAFVPLGGASDGAYLDGHGYTYEGATWGKVADALMRAGCSNPVLFFDELDKVSETHKGREVVNLLVHMTDPAQNSRFCDKYFRDVDIDLSRCLMIFSYNDEARVSAVLRDRMTCVRAQGYSARDKQRIAREHLLPSVLAEFGMPPGALTLGDAELAALLAAAGEEQGVRGLRRALHDVVSNLNLERLLAAPDGEQEQQQQQQQQPQPQPLRVTLEHVRRFVTEARERELGAGGGGAVPAGMYT